MKNFFFGGALGALAYASARTFWVMHERNAQTQLLLAQLADERKKNQPEIDLKIEKTALFVAGRKDDIIFQR